VDGLREHIHIDIIEFCLNHQILVVCLVPSHSTHYLQPLDVAVFSSYQHFYSQEVDKFSRSAGSGIGKENFLQFLFPARDKTFAPEKRLAANAFEATGIWPLNQARIEDRFPPPPPAPPTPPHYERSLENKAEKIEASLRECTPSGSLFTDAAEEISNLSSELVRVRTQLACKEVEQENTAMELERIKGTKADRRVLTKTRLCTSQYLAKRKRERDLGKGARDTGDGIALGGKDTAKGQDMKKGIGGGKDEDMAEEDAGVLVGKENILPSEGIKNGRKKKARRDSKDCIADTIDPTPTGSQVLCLGHFNSMV